jgi:5,10-methylenetetrahydromethanopterin reductase
MEFGITCSKVDDVGLAAHAENLGYDQCWVTDSPMLRSNPFAVLALAAQQTRTIRLSVGVAVPGLRVAPETANGIATINRLAPGRTFLGIGTGNTAMRTLLQGEEVAYDSDDGTHNVRFQNTDRNHIDIEHPIPIHVAGLGPRAQALAGELGDGLITSIPRGGSIPTALANARTGAERAGRSMDDFYTTALVNLVMLQPGETLSSERVIAECGAAIMANVHYLMDFVRETGSEPPEVVRPIWEEYLDFHRSRDAASSGQKLHESHYSFLDPDEACFITPQMIRAFCLAGQPEELVEQLRELESQGLKAISFITPEHLTYRVYEDLARKVIAKM